MAAAEDPTFEKVYTVDDWYDGPRCGVANFGGQPHLFESTFNDIDSDEDEVFLLWKIDDSDLALVLESWAIWRRWEVAYRCGDTTKDTHPVLPADRARHDQLQVLLAERGLNSQRAEEDGGPGQTPCRPEALAIRSVADFVPSGEDNGHASLLVRWHATSA